MKININLSRVNQKISNAFERTSDRFSDVLQEMITSVIWDWNNVTYRRNGDVVFTPRDIVDLGGLRDSQSLEFPTDLKANFSYSVVYAIAVHEGYITKKGNYIPGRPWTEEATRRFDFVATFSDVFAL
jgi:hypothetical protein